MKHTLDALTTEGRITEAPVSRSATGYGPKIPTRYQLRYAGRWHRVYMMQYGNSGTPFIVKGGEDLILSLTAEHMLTDLSTEASK